MLYCFRKKSKSKSKSKIFWSIKVKAKAKVKLKTESKTTLAESTVCVCHWSIEQHAVHIQVDHLYSVQNFQKIQILDAKFSFLSTPSTNEMA